MPDFVNPLALAGALSSGLIAGILFTFSNFVMPALGTIPPAEGMRAMQRINVTVLNPLFFALFFGSAALGLVAIVLGILHRAEPGSTTLLIAGALYLFGTFGVTAARNVPLNEALRVAEADSAAGQKVWQHYLQAWCKWNHLRTLAGAASALAYLLV